MKGLSFLAVTVFVISCGNGSKTEGDTDAEVISPDTSEMDPVLDPFVDNDMQDISEDGISELDDVLEETVAELIDIPLEETTEEDIVEEEPACNTGEDCLTERPNCGDFPEAGVHFRGCAMTGTMDEECTCQTGDELINATYIDGGWPDDPDFIFPAPYLTDFEPRIEISIPDGSSALGASCLIHYPLNPGMLDAPEIYDCLGEGSFVLGGEAICSGGTLRAILCCVAGSQCAVLSTPEGAVACEDASGDFILRLESETACPTE